MRVLPRQYRSARLHSETLRASEGLLVPNLLLLHGRAA